jgi:hypothetical protein
MVAMVHGISLAHASRGGGGRPSRSLEVTVHLLGFGPAR